MPIIPLARKAGTVYRCNGCHIAIDFRWFCIMSFQCLPSFPVRDDPITQQPTNSPCPIRSLSTTWHSRTTFGKSSAGILKDRASFQTGLWVPFLTLVFFLFTFFPSIISVILTYGSENGIKSCYFLWKIWRTHVHIFTCKFHVNDPKAFYICSSDNCWHAFTGMESSLKECIIREELNPLCKQGTIPLVG